MKKETHLITIRQKLRNSNQQKPINGKPKIVGKVEYYRKFYSKALNNKRDIIVWLPPSYKKEKERCYPVIYMHDGQNIMNPKTAYIGIDWQIDETVTRLIKAGEMQEIIIVGIYNTPERLEEYSDSAKGKNYMKFVVEQLKPFIDKYYRTKSDSEYTATIGSSMGGLISFLLAWNYPDVFGKAACMSSSFYYDGDKAIEMVKDYTGEKKKIKIYIDHGEDGLPRGQRMFCELSQKGYLIGTDIDYYYSPGADHTETEWARRLQRPLLFFFGTRIDYK
jgi:predicted alpha/beta superfamily hydrolase